MKTNRYDVIVIGAGPSASVAAAYLHAQGHSVRMLEKSVFPRFVIGESLLPRCMDHFEEVGLLDCLKAQDFEVKKGARFIRHGQVCNFDFSKKHTDGWDWTWQVPRADFDHALASELEDRGVEVTYGAEVVDVRFDENGGSTIDFKDSEGAMQSVEADFVIDSSGFGRVLPRLLGLENTTDLPSMGSIFAHVEDRDRPAGHEGSIITFDILELDVWLWVIPFSNGRTSIGVVAPVEWLESFSGTKEEKLQEMMARSAHYKDRFSKMELCFEPRQIKNYSCAVKQLHGKGYALTGNSAEFLDPVFSSGVTFATESGLRAAKLASRQLKGESIDWDEEYTKYIKGGVTVFKSYVKEWYSGNLQTLFFHEPENAEIKKKICAVLAGYVWDRTNPFVRKHDRILATMAGLVEEGGL